MKLIKEYWICVLVIILLIFGIWWSIQKTNQKVASDKAKKEAQTIEFKKADGTTVLVKNVYGQVMGWEANKGILKLKINQDEIEDFQIDPLTAKVMVPKAKRGDNDNQLLVFKKAAGKHWETAFCLGDKASLQVDSLGKVELAINDGRRMCGYLGAWE